MPPVPGMAQQLEEQVFRPFRALPETRELINNIDDSKPTEDEIYEAISRMARYKAPGPDEISSELVRADPIRMSKILEWIFFGLITANTVLTLTLGFLIVWNGLGLALWLKKNPAHGGWSSV